MHLQRRIAAGSAAAEIRHRRLVQRIGGRQHVHRHRIHVPGVLVIGDPELRVIQPGVAVHLHGRVGLCIRVVVVGAVAVEVPGVALDGAIRVRPAAREGHAERSRARRRIGIGRRHRAAVARDEQADRAAGCAALIADAAPHRRPDHARRAGVRRLGSHGVIGHLVRPVAVEIPVVAVRPCGGQRDRVTEHARWRAGRQLQRGRITRQRRRHHQLAHPALVAADVERRGAQMHRRISAQRQHVAGIPLQPPHASEARRLLVEEPVVAPVHPVARQVASDHAVPGKLQSTHDRCSSESRRGGRRFSIGIIAGIGRHADHIEGGAVAGHGADEQVAQRREVVTASGNIRGSTQAHVVVAEGPVPVPVSSAVVAEPQVVFALAAVAHRQRVHVGADCSGLLAIHQHSPICPGDLARERGAAAEEHGVTVVGKAHQA